MPLTSQLITGNPLVPDPEVKATKPHRRFTAKYKLSILGEVDACTTKGQIGAILRREGLYSSNLTTWRKQREKGILQRIGHSPGDLLSTMPGKAIDQTKTGSAAGTFS